MPGLIMVEGISEPFINIFSNSGFTEITLARPACIWRPRLLLLLVLLVYQGYIINILSISDIAGNYLLIPSNPVSLFINEIRLLFFMRKSRFKVQ
jgi:hypothetical protein